MIDLLPDGDQQELLASVTDFLANEFPIDRLRPKAGAFEVPPQAERWNQFAEMGWFAIALPEAQGGVGYTLAEEVLLFREFGRHLLSPALAAATVAARAALAVGKPELAAEIASGKHRLGWGLVEGDCKTYLIDAQAADLVLALDGDLLRLYERNACADRVAARGLDGTLPLERSRLAGPALLESGDAGLAATARLLLAAMACGVTEATRDLAVEYAKLRQQFGQPIGAFQAVKHMCADMAVRAEAAWCQLSMATLALRDGHESPAFQAAAASIVSLNAAVVNAEECIQIHGGIGFTAECDAHLFLKRAHLLERLSGRVRGAQTRLLTAAAPA